MFSDTFDALCKEKGVSASKACVEMGLSRSISAKWRSTNTNPSAEVLPKIAEYFGVSVDYLLTGEKNKPRTDEERPPITDADIKAAFWGGEKDLTPKQIEELWQDAKDYIKFKTEQKKK